MTSTHAVSVVKRLFSAKRAGHAGTLDPLASGALPIALGEATKTVPFVMDGRKLYRVHRALGRRTRHRRRRGPRHRHQRASARRRRRSARCCRPITGAIQQVPPRYSAIKIEGERAYDLARDGETVELEARPVEIGRLELVDTPDPDHAVLRGRMRQRHLCPLAGPRYRPRFGLFRPCQRAAPGRGRPVRPEETMILLEQLEALCHRAAAGEASLADALMPVETALDDIPALAVSGQMRQGFKEAKPFCCADGTRPISVGQSMSRRRATWWPSPNWITAKSSPSACSTWPAWWAAPASRKDDRCRLPPAARPKS